MKVDRSNIVFKQKSHGTSQQGTKNVKTYNDVMNNTNLTRTCENLGRTHVFSKSLGSCCSTNVIPRIYSGYESRTGKGADFGYDKRIISVVICDRYSVTVT